ncbi:MAG: 16S rRNA (uracil(1498)-N(3))-methyltransferase [Gammaproteobacteria bacterium]|nr:16S rRNA (uracil(1498)-N(3))-methyltransferase [Gammaproteobacteria bacterium]NNF61032.1 16S rRNA (uracil(1498)-N(3))-methyltransferase [Gammaproteobacteria bacterium]NNM21880.1 16S rRNA (uracil(1498)-N(3))-methyltransferase [Gammaproteobacteria bacterium]
MRSHRVFVRQPLAGHNSITVDAATSHYLTRVLRLRAGAALTAFDGNGGEYAANLERATRDEAVLSIGAHSAREAESHLAMTLAQGIARGERMDQVIQKATELGVQSIVPLLTDHTVVRLDKKRAARRHAHWLKIAVSACEQCGRNRIPAMASPMSIDDWLRTTDESATRLMLQPGSTTGLGALGAKHDNVTLLIGPEGGLSGREQELAAGRGFAAVSLGPRVLRTETAALAALAILQSRWGDAG